MHLAGKQKVYGAAALALLAGGASFAGLRSVRPDAPLSVASISGAPPSVSSKPAETSAAAEPKEVVVAMAGAVKIPGLLHLSPDARVGDAIKRAGGALADADLDRINLAAKLVDGDQVYVPHRKAAEPEKVAEAAKVSPRHRGGSMAFHYAPIAPLMPPPLHGELPKHKASAIDLPSIPNEGLPPVGPPSDASSVPNEPPASTTPEIEPPSSGGHSHHSAKVKATEPVSLNSAGEAELETLPGVGPATAQKILDYRQEHGGFRSVEEIMSVKGIGAKKFEKMKPYLKL